MVDFDLYVINKANKPMNQWKAKDKLNYQLQ